MRHRDFRTPAERSMDDLNQRRRELLYAHSTKGLNVAERGELARVNRQLEAARRNVMQMREGLR